MLKPLFDYTVSLFVIIVPFVSLVILLSLLPRSKEKNTARIALKSTLGVLIGSAVCILTGSWIMQFFGIDISAFRVMGGFVLLTLALQMVQAKVSSTRHTEKETEEAKVKTDISIIPLAIPGTLGPGTITTLLIYRNQAEWLNILFLFSAVLINCIILYVILANAVWIEKKLTKTTLNVFTRLMGLVVGSIAVQFIVEGTKVLWLK